MVVVNEEEGLGWVGRRCSGIDGFGGAFLRLLLLLLTTEEEVKVVVVVPAALALPPAAAVAASLSLCFEELNDRSYRPFLRLLQSGVAALGGSPPPPPLLVLVVVLALLTLLRLVDFERRYVAAMVVVAVVLVVAVAVGVGTTVLFREAVWILSSGLYLDAAFTVVFGISFFWWQHWQ